MVRTEAYWGILAEVIVVTVSGTVPLFNHDTAEYVTISTAPVCVDWQVSTSPNMTSPVSSGRAYTSSDIDYTIKVLMTTLTCNSKLTQCR